MQGSVRKRTLATHNSMLAIFFGASVLELCSELTNATVENSFGGFLKGSVDFFGNCPSSREGENEK